MLAELATLAATSKAVTNKMEIQRMPIALFVNALVAAYERKDGYIMGAKGQNPKKLNKWFFNQYADRSEYSEKQEKKALYWREHAARVWDCNGLPEGIYEEYTGVNINTKARYNYAQWCEPKGTGMIPVEYRVPGAAVFTGSKASKIPHVMYLWKPVEDGKPEGDWYLIEARGVLYGVVKTRLYNRKPTFWGLMTKYFDYGNAPETENKQPEGIALNPYKEPAKNIKKGFSGDGVRWVQWELQRHDAKCLPKHGIDGDFGKETLKAVLAFQRTNGLDPDGIVGKLTRAALKRA